MKAIEIVRSLKEEGRVVGAAAKRRRGGPHGVADALHARAWLLSWRILQGGFDDHRRGEGISTSSDDTARPLAVS